ncbi:hypothetical protein [Paenibacillus crassostreae]|uniref:Glycosyltransferase n=1 Tax=Paenibacillus crassostreae TaxID=1763538 RepID=A0A162RK07_9BACL|nr:hypothetical protein [Paenibacillus crassostreae]AOZ92578.1 hypothetical protein LPB68_10245 [Paenibacillus crassostreae]OAB72527.1 hypothetical protein PNBC_16690 [Paenibacillus crassostreae]
MENSTPQPIQQQLYTRERRGIFRSTEGFDTIARSKGLDHSFIKKTLHPFCAYDAPAELSARGEKDTTLYPDALHLVHNDNDQTIIGRSTYQSADFTGLRSAFFTHNYIIPSERLDEIVNHYSAWLHADFIDNYDIEQGQDLPELSSLPVASPPIRTDVVALLNTLNIDERMFKQLLFAVMTSVTGKKKVYISLDVPAEQISTLAKQLLEVIYANIPYAFRKMLGFLTFSKEPQSKKGIHVMFVERGSLRPGDRNIEKDFTFDLVAKRVTNGENELIKQPYFDFAWHNLNRPERAEHFYSFAELMLSDMNHIRQTSVSSYNDLAVFFQIEEGNESLFINNKNMVLHGLLEYLSLPGAMTSKVRLNDIFLARFDQEFDLIKQGEVPDLGIVEAFRDYYGICGKHNEGKIVTYLMVAISHAASTKRKEAVASFYKVIESSPKLSKAFFDMVLSSGFEKSLFEPYILEKLHHAPKARDVMQLVGVWGKNHPIVTRNTYFVDQAKSQLSVKLRKESEPVTAVNALLKQQLKIEEDWEPQGPGHNAVAPDYTVMDQLAYVANLFLLTELDLDTLPREQLLKIDFLQEQSEVKQWASKFDTRIKSQVAVMLAAYAWFSHDQPDESVFDGLSPMELDRVQQLGRQWLQNQIVPAQFGRLALAFYQGGQAGVNYPGLINFIHRNVQDHEDIYSFFQWSATQQMFAAGRGLIPAYASAIIFYFKNMDRDAFKKKDVVKKYFTSVNPKLKAVYAKAELELSSPFMKFLRRNSRQLVKMCMVVGVVLIVLVGGFYGLKATGIFDKEKVVVNPTPPVVPPVDESISEDVVVYADQVEHTEDSEVKDAQLVFLFKNAGTCEAFDASNITLELADGTDPKILTNLEPDVKCEVVVESDSSETNGLEDTGVAAGKSDGASKDAETEKGDSATTNDEPGKVGEDGAVEGTETGTGTGTGTEAESEVNSSGAGIGTDVKSGTGSETEIGTEEGTDSGAVTGTDDATHSGEAGSGGQASMPIINIEEYKSSITVKLPEVTLENLVGSTVKVGIETFTVMKKPSM